MELLQLHYFQTVARLEHMTKAANELKIAQPSLSKTISRLEEDIGVPLFDRQHRQISLNQYGKVFLNRVNRIFMELEEARLEIQDIKDHSEKNIRLAVSIPRVLPELIGSFLKENPQVRFQQLLKSTTEMKEELLKGEIDFCISSLPIDDPDIVWEQLITEEIYLMVPPDHALANRETIDLHEMKHESFISMNMGYGLRNLTDEFCREAGITPHIAFEGDEPGVIGDLVTQGLGIAFIPAISWSKIQNPALKRLKIAHPTCQRTIGIGWSKRHHFTNSAQTFHSYLLDYFKKLLEQLIKEKFNQ